MLGRQPAHCCGLRGAGNSLLGAACCLPHSPPTVPPARQQGPAVLVNMAFVILGLAFTTEAMSTFDRMLTATDELWFEIAVDTDHDGKISPEEIAAATGGSISKSLSMRSLRRLDEASRRTMHTCDAPDEITDGGSSAASGANVAAGASKQPIGGVGESKATAKVAAEAKVAAGPPFDWILTREGIVEATGGSISKSLSMRSLRRLDEASWRTMHTGDAPDETAAAATLDEITGGGSSAASGAIGGVGESKAIAKVAAEAKVAAGPPFDWILTPHPGPAENSNAPQTSGDATTAVNPATGYQKSPAAGIGNQLRRPSHSRNGGHWSLWPVIFARKFFISVIRCKGNTVGAV